MYGRLQQQHSSGVFADCHHVSAIEATEVNELPRIVRQELQVLLNRLHKAGLSDELIAAQTGLSRTGVPSIGARHAAGGTEVRSEALGSHVAQADKESL